MGGRQIGRFLELAVYSLPGRVEMFIQQVELDELIDQPQVIRRELGSFFKGLARFIISFGLAEDQPEGCVGLWILRREPDLIANDRFGIVEPIKRAISGRQEKCGRSQIRPFSQQIGEWLDYRLTTTRTEIDLGEPQNRIIIIRID